MKRLKVLNLILIASSFAAFGCTPEFNRKIKSVATPSTPSVTVQTPTGMRLDANLVGGGSSGTSTNFRLSAVSIGYAVKRESSSADFTVKGGINGALH